MAINFDFNGRPVIIGPNDTATSHDPVAVASSSIFTIEPDNIEATYSINYGSTTVQKTLPASMPIPYPVFGVWDSNQVTIKNLSSKSEATIAAGYFGVPANVQSAPSGHAEIDQFQHCCIETTTSNMTLSLTNRSTDSVLAAIIQGGLAPVFVALNTTYLPDQFQDIAGLQKIAGNNFTASNNWYGATITIINLTVNRQGSSVIEIDMT